MLIKLRRLKLLVLFAEFVGGHNSEAAPPCAQLYIHQGSASYTLVARRGFFSRCPPSIHLSIYPADYLDQICETKRVDHFADLPGGVCPKTVNLHYNIMRSHKENQMLSALRAHTQLTLKCPRRRRRAELNDE